MTITQDVLEDVDQDEAQPAPTEFEAGGQATVDDLREINLGDEGENKPTFISANLKEEEARQYISFLREYRDIFAWNYSEMPGLNPEIAVHKLATHPKKRPVKQPQRRTRPELTAQIEAEVDKLINAGFIREVKYPPWLANIVPVKKKNGQIRVCIDFRDLNGACPTDDFPLPIIELLVDATTGYETLSFMDGYSGYNQIRMAPEDEEMTAFRTPRGVFCYKVMSFGLKNAGATYQRAMSVIFGDMLHDTIECYVDDLVVKTKEKENHVEDLRKIFERLRRYKLKMNPLKCAFGVSSGKFLGLVVRNKGIEIDPTKIKAIAEMPPRNLRELKGLQGRLAYIRRFISNLAGQCLPFSRLMKNGVPFEWDQQCQNAFNSIKEYLLKPPVLMSAIKGKPLLLYITALDGSLGALLAQHNEHGKENALYYLSRTLVGAEVNYSPIEKTCLALVFALQKLKHYVLEHEVKLISRADPLKYILSRPILSGKIAKWAVILQQFAIEYVLQRAVKGQALADFLAAHPIPDDSPLVTDLPDEEVMQVEIQKGWEMYFDGVSRSPDGKKQENPKNNKVGIGIVFVTPDNAIITHSFALSEGCSNNEAEYEAVIAGLELALQIPIEELSIYGDSELVRRTNAQADSLASLAASLTLPDSKTITFTIGERRVLQPLKEVSDLVPILVVTTKGENEEDWREPFIAYLQHGRVLEDKVKRIEVRRRATKFVLWKDGTLYKRYLDGMFMQCIAKERIQEAMAEIHAGVCGAHQSGPKLHMQLKRLGYYWPTMIADCIDYARRCQVCQFHGNFLHQPPEPLHFTTCSWPFAAWGMDIIGPFVPPSSARYRYILAATDYFSEWAEAVALKDIKSTVVSEYIRTHIIYRFGIPESIIMDNGQPFRSDALNKLFAKYKIKNNHSSRYHAPANGLAEVFNKTLCKILKNMVDKNKKAWHEKLQEALWAYRTSHRTPTQATPYSLVFRGEAVLLLEVQIPSLRVAIQQSLTEDESARVRLTELETLDERRLYAQ
ncbi:uncharacterized protein LOC114264016 [Camellia sinensis]|uniref:uncharacterized protein LOC114264016 n=1 Tax=Camellia sinensis TaxID=4442 RepID=UPI0010359746|nr:uncharacterized protein LOC114264016 [Camellia sinensis]